MVSMEIIKFLIDFILHIEVHLDQIIGQYHNLTYLIIFLIIFVETGVVVMPFLPGDSLLFALGAIAARGSLSIPLLFILILLGAFLGDNLNYFFGKKLGPKVFQNENSKWLSQKNLLKAQSFYDKYGVKTVIIARFVPIVRTFAPFVAGVGNMKYSKFISFSFLGALLWVSSFLGLGYFFGNLPSIQKNFKLVVVAIIIISLIPPVLEFIKSKKK